MQINLSFDASLSNTVQTEAHKQALIEAANEFASNFTNNISLNIIVGQKDISAVACSNCTYIPNKISYSTYVSLLSKTATTPEAQNTIKYLEGISDPTHGAGIELTNAQAKVLGIMSANASSIDGHVYFSSNQFYDFNQLDGGSVGAYDAKAALYHEISEVMGRVALGDNYNGYTALNLSRFTSPGHIQGPFDTSKSVYFSLDGGVTNNGLFNNLINTGDYADWSTGHYQDAFGNGNPGVVSILSKVDLAEMSVLGYNLAAPAHQITPIASPNSTVIYEIYQAAFGRLPDTGGFTYWVNQADTNHLSAVQVAQSFTTSQEFQNTFGTNPTNTTFLTELYQHVLGRAPDQAGLNYWLQQANNGESHAQLMVDFATSAENVQLVGTHVSNGMYWTT